MKQTWHDGEPKKPKTGYRGGEPKGGYKGGELKQGGYKVHVHTTAVAFTNPKLLIWFDKLVWVHGTFIHAFPPLLCHIRGSTIGPLRF
jgi:hypothetical protein